MVEKGLSKEIAYKLEVKEQSQRGFHCFRSEEKSPLTSVELLDKEVGGGTWAKLVPLGIS